MQTVYEAFLDALAKVPEQEFIHVPAMAGRAYTPEGASYTYSEAGAQIERLRADYARAGFGHGHRVALLLENRPEFVFHYLALNGLGVGVVPVNPEYRHDEMLYQIVNDSDGLQDWIMEKCREDSRG